MLNAIVTNYRTPEDLEAFLTFWKEAGIEVPVSLTVANVDSQDADVEVVDHFPWVDHHVIYSDNVGYARACNDGAALGDGDVIAFFNADTRVLKGCVDACYTNLVANEGWGVLGPRQLDDRGRVTHGGILGTPSAPQLRGWMERDNPGYCDIQEDAVSVMGSAYFIKRATWDELSNCTVFRQVHPHVSGAFLPTSHYYEETWASYHARAHGWKVVYYGLAKMIHRWHKASPVGGWADEKFGESRTMFRAMCDAHEIERD